MPSTLHLQRPARPPPATPLPPPPQPPYRSAASSSCLGAVCIAVTKASSVFTSGTYILKEYDLVAGMDLNAHPFPDLTGTNSLSLEIIQCNGPIEARWSMQHAIFRVGDHDVNQLQIQRNSSSPQDLVIDSMPEVRKTKDLTRYIIARPSSFIGAKDN
ncbi:hypothetical protein ZWY2020_042654 [Hordeum vulgare]|nr:hypothetical protein ZWY2020_042654 [Hordeum vulgare]